MGHLCPCPNSKKSMKKVPGASHGAPYCPWALGQCPSFQMVIPPLTWCRYMKKKIYIYIYFFFFYYI
ncbi:unnamed protein product [Staurois parvus]|uniref:Uncharacterized protein n=1 Tax=Staurois parvus TaxID=386267 RepID=A0ABN9DUT3_9NEOB|nr:unnamed protein product [Staurois parvus]